MSLQAGFSKRSIVPDFPVSLAGYGGDNQRFCEEVLEPIFLTCIAVANGEKTILLFTVDTCGLLLSHIKEMREMICTETGIPTEHIFFGATHCHNGASMYPTGMPQAIQYNEFLFSVAVEASKNALADLAPATLFANNPKIEGMNFTRHYIGIDGKKYSANMAEVAQNALKKDTWSAEERAKIEDLADTTPETVGVGGEVTDFRYTRSQAYFTYKKGGQTFYNRITYNGADGWRLQTNTKSYNHFKDIGAGQSLAMYMDEGFNDVEIPLRITATEDVPTSGITISAEGTNATVKLSCNYFSLDFCDKNGTALYNVSGMELSDKGEIVLSGKMNSTDAVYGGGGTLFEKQHSSLLSGQALHAKRLCFTHPTSGERMEFECPLPEEFEKLIEILKKDSGV
jgi:hypothetical protein